MMFQITQELKEMTVKLLESLPCGLGERLAARLTVAWHDPQHIKEVTPADPDKKDIDPNNNTPAA